MIKFYTFIFFVSLTYFASGQSNKAADNIIGTPTVQAKVMRFYPNPATNFIYFEITKPIQKELTLQVYNFIGKKVYESHNISQKTTIPLSEFFRGVYIFQLRDKAGRIIESGKFQVNS